jgi:hypothetical protein
MLVESTYHNRENWEETGEEFDYIGDLFEYLEDRYQNDFNVHFTLEKDIVILHEDNEPHIFYRLVDKKDNGYCGCNSGCDSCLMLPKYRG